MGAIWRVAEVVLGARDSTCPPVGMCNEKVCSLEKRWVTPELRVGHHPAASVLGDGVFNARTHAVHVLVECFLGWGDWKGGRAFS